MKQRIEWIDLVKAVSVLLVVFMHASNTLVDLGGTSPVTTALQYFNHLVEPMRMPAFFLVSGMLAASAIHRPWRATTRRTTGMIYLYVTWMLLFFGFIALFGASVTGPGSSILFARSGYWYLYAMALFFVLARLLRNQPAWLVVIVALVPNLLRPATQHFFEGLVPGSMYTSMAMNLAFFLMGAYFKDLIGSLVARTTWASTWIIGAVAIVSGVLWLNAPATAGQSYLLMSLIWVPFGLSLAMQLTRGGAPEWARYVGARTVSIYVWQWPLLFLAAEFVPGAALTGTVAHVLFPLAFTALVAASALWLHSRPALKPLFSAPAWATHPQGVRIPEQLRRRVIEAEPATVTAGR
ncbi:MAG: acyltransferase family protein [Candidatus Nanopelagicales bacterium]